MTGIGPEDRLDEAIKQVKIVKGDTELVTSYQSVLSFAIYLLGSIKVELEENRDG